jgi:hypothetical protein
MKKIGILYICTGKYKIFWKSFYESCEQFLLLDKKYKKEYFVFTDAEHIEYEEDLFVHKIYQTALDWPYITLLRFKIFNSMKELYKDVDYLYFFNANMLCTNKITTDFLPAKDKQLAFLQHPGFYNKTSAEYTYERNMKSLSGIQMDKGKYYFMGALNGGKKEAYLQMCEVLEKNIDKDLKNNIIALWHDESHLNRYAIDNGNIITILDPSYGYPEDWQLPFEKKILIRDKNKYGGHYFLRNRPNIIIRFFRKLFK